MRIENNGVRVTADYDVGVNKIESVKHTQTKISMPRCSARFFCDKKPVELILGRPDAVSMTGLEITVTFSHKIDGMADNRISVELIYDGSQYQNGIVLTAKLTNFSKQDIILDHIKIIDVQSSRKGDLILGHGVGEWSFYKQGFQSFSASGALRVNKRSWRPRFRFLRLMEENVTNPASRKAGDFISEWVTQITNNAGGHSLLAGFIQGARTLGDVRLVVNHKKSKFVSFTARSHFDRMLLQPQDSISTEPFYIRFGSQGRDFLGTWADIVGKRMKARVGKPALVGWCSWYYYYTKISEDEVLANTSSLSELRDQLNVQYVQVDDGYQSCVGDWLSTNPRFKSGMKEMAGRIANAGFIPGIWTAPFYARPGSKLFKEHKDWFLKNKAGRPVKGGWNPLWGGKVYSLDTTHPGTQSHLRSVYTSLREMGYKLFKIDFLYAATIPAHRYNPHTTRAEALRIGLEIIRESVGEESFLIGCGCPIMPAVGIVDAMRIGMDVTPTWKNTVMTKFLDDRNALSTRNSIINTFNRAFMHQRLFINDPDCLLVREDRNRMTLDQIKALATAIALSGGMFVISDNMQTISDHRLKILKTAFDYRTLGMETVNLHKYFEPEIVVGRDRERVLLGLFNLTDKSITKIFDLKDLMPMNELGAVRQIVDVWNNKELKHQNGLLRIGNMLPNSARLIEIKTSDKG